MAGAQMFWREISESGYTRLIQISPKTRLTPQIDLVTSGESL
jgi:hypothetical protein